jgi:hypothetical protein
VRVHTRERRKGKETGGCLVEEEEGKKEQKEGEGEILDVQEGAGGRIKWE